MKLQLEQIGEDVVLLFPPELLARLGLREGDELIATMGDWELHLARASDAGESDADASGRQISAPRT